MAVSSQGHSPLTSSKTTNPVSTRLPPSMVEGPTTQQPSLNDLRTIAADIKDTLLAAITDLQHDIQALADMVREVECTTAHQHTAIRHIHQQVDTHTLQLYDLQRHMGAWITMGDNIILD